MIRFFTILFLLSVSCFAQVKMFYLTNLNANVQEQINARAKIIGTNLLSANLMYDGASTNELEFDDFSRIDLDGTDTSVGGVASLYLDGGITTLRGVTNLQVVTPGIYGGSVETGYVLRLSDDSNGEAEYVPTQVDNVAALKALPAGSVPEGWIVRTLGYYTDSDGGEGVYRYWASSVDTANDGTVIDPTYLPGRFILQSSEAINVKQFGAKGDDVADDWGAITAAITAVAASGGGVVSLPKPSVAYKISQQLVISNSFVTLDGGSRGTIIKNYGTNATIKVTSARSTVIKNMSLYGAIQAAYGVGSVCTYGIEYEAADYAILRNVSILYHGSHGIYLHGGGSSHEYYEMNVRHNAGDGLNSVSPSGSEQNGNSMKIVGGHYNLNGGAGIRWNAAALDLLGAACEANIGPGVCADSSTSTLTTKAFNVWGGYFEQNVGGQIEIKAGAGFAGGRIGGAYLRWGLGGGTSTRNALIYGSGAGSIQFLEIESNSYSLFPVDAGVPYWINLSNLPTGTCIVEDMGQTALVVQIGSARLPSTGLTSASIDTSTKLRAIVTDETGTGSLVFATNPQFAASIGIGVAAAGSTATPIYTAGTSNGGVGPRFENTSTGTSSSAKIDLYSGNLGLYGQIAFCPANFVLTNIAGRLIHTLSASASGVTEYLGTGQNWDVQINNGVIARVSTSGLLVDHAGTGATQSAGAALEVVSTTKGFLLPRMTKAQRDAIGTPPDGLMIYQTDGTAGVKARIGGAWHTLNTTADP